MLSNHRLPAFNAFLRAPRAFPLPLQFPTTTYFPNVTRMSLSTNTSACMFLPTACAAAVAS